jgi:Putative  PD-(D/E)XK family member, (DUF4420)
MGELAVLRFLAAEIGYPLAIDSWKGPLDGIHDFSHLGISIEVKTALGTNSLIHVSHLAQLEGSALDTLVIARLRFREGPDGNSISDVAQQIRGQLEQMAPLARSNFDEKLLRVGYLDVDRDAYDTIRFVPVDLYGFNVCDGFPRLTPSFVPQGIVDGSYTIDERAAAKFRIEASDIGKLIGRMKGVTA